MSAPVAVAACLCALSVFVATGLDRADAVSYTHLTLPTIRLV